MRLTLLGAGAMASARYAPAGLLVERGRSRVMLDGGPGAAPDGHLEAWLVTDDRSELIGAIRRLAQRHGLQPKVAAYARDDLNIRPRPVVHTSHPTVGYLIEVPGRTAVWAPEFFRFPHWAAGADLFFAEAAGWSQPIRFVGGVGGHAAVQDVAAKARRRGIRRLVFAHIGRPTLRALAQGRRPPYGEIGVEGHVYRPRSP